MGAGASFLRKKTPQRIENRDVKVETAGDETEGKAGILEQKARQAPDDDESSQAMEGLHEIVCRLAQGHPTQTPKRWHLITRKLNRAMRKRKIPAQPLKALFAKEGLCIPKCWVAEKTQEAIKKELAAANQHMEKNKGIFGRPLFGKKKSIAEQHQGGSKSGEDADQAGESDTEPESDIDEDVVRGAGNGDTTELAYKYEPLSKYEVFSFMRRVHDRIGPGMVETDEVIEEIQRAENMVNMMYEDLPADKLKAISQQNRIRSSLREDSFVYGEITLLSFLQVMVKLKRIHGHMMTNGGSFWDLGAGTGKLVIAAAMMNNFESCYGVEVLEDLRFASRPKLDRWRKQEAPKLPAVKAAIRVDFIFADAMKQEGWVVEATVLFVHTNFSAENLRELRRKAGGMKVGAICLSVSLAAVDEDKWGLLAVEHVQTSWGATKLYIHEKLAA